MGEQHGEVGECQGEAGLVLIVGGSVFVVGGPGPGAGRLDRVACRLGQAPPHGHRLLGRGECLRPPLQLAELVAEIGERHREVAAMALGVLLGQAAADLHCRPGLRQGLVPQPQLCEAVAEVVEGGCEPGFVFGGVGGCEPAADLDGGLGGRERLGVACGIGEPPAQSRVHPRQFGRTIGGVRQPFFGEPDGQGRGPGVEIGVSDVRQLGVDLLQQIG
nr:hypothetical protein [Streptomyces sp. TLI_235]